jgi:hypothetical protein
VVLERRRITVEESTAIDNRIIDAVMLAAYEKDSLKMLALTMCIRG